MLPSRCPRSACMNGESSHCMRVQARAVLQQPAVVEIDAARHGADEREHVERRSARRWRSASETAAHRRNRETCVDATLPASHVSVSAKSLPSGDAAAYARSRRDWRACDVPHSRINSSGDCQNSLGGKSAASAPARFGAATAATARGRRPRSATDCPSSSDSNVGRSHSTHASGSSSVRSSRELRRVSVKRYRSLVAATRPSSNGRGTLGGPGPLVPRRVESLDPLLGREQLHQPARLAGRARR